MACKECVHFEVCALKEDFAKCAKEVERSDSFAMEYYNKKKYFVPLLTCTKYKKEMQHISTVSCPIPGDYDYWAKPIPVTGSGDVPYDTSNKTVCQTESRDVNEEVEL